ncbi:hypothetical protein H4683_003698 [Filibacter limicola]|uniref:Uncharacterized protein n=1 Tax=Sporosarcina limicola TaxID=34101 RepID=A0A927MM99_9BACL|nr:hypothetical protein [Sporosarcina limicola]
MYAWRYNISINYINFTILSHLFQSFVSRNLPTIFNGIRMNRLTDSSHNYDDSFAIYIDGSTRITKKLQKIIHFYRIRCNLPYYEKGPAEENHPHQQGLSHYILILMPRLGN